MNIIIRNEGDTPIYEQIVTQIKGAILAGELAEGEGLPSMRLLARELRISLITTKRAYEELEREGFVVTVPGPGQLCRRGQLGAAAGGASKADGGASGRRSRVRPDGRRVPQGTDRGRRAVL